MISGLLLPGRLVANLYFSVFSHEVIVLTVNLAGDLKLAQYLKIPWKTIFVTQVGLLVITFLFDYSS